MGRFIDLTNKIFDKWLVLKRGPNDKQKKVQWICKCDCGVIKAVRAKTLIDGSSKGCRNCMPKRTKSASPLAYRHGMSHSPTYKSWINIIARCTNPNDTAYKWYGAKGITVCQRWRDDFLNFLEDMGERPFNKSIDRIDPFKGYFKENCRWATIREQNSNKRCHHSDPYL